MERIGLVVHPRRAIDRALTTLEAWSSAHGIELVQVRTPGQERVVAEAADAADCDLIAALGGDGTTLAALRVATAARRPVLGVACGSLGALTATSAGNLEPALERVLAGDWTARKLPALEVLADESHRAINDLVIVRDGAGQVAVSIFLDDELYVRYGGDGVVVATPLGSSAYTLGCGRAGARARLVRARRHAARAARRLLPAARHRSRGRRAHRAGDRMGRSEDRARRPDRRDDRAPRTDPAHRPAAAR
jgi:NAD+ kinase